MSDEYREIRVRPVVRYIVTHYRREDLPNGRQFSASNAFGEFDNVVEANAVAGALHAQAPNGAVLETARQLRIEWLRGPGEPKESIRWELLDPDAPAMYRQNRAVGVIQRLYDSEINAAIESFWDGGFSAKLGDPLNGFVAEETGLRTWAVAEEWLYHEALRRYPTSVFAQREAVLDAGAQQPAPQQ